MPPVEPMVGAARVAEILGMSKQWVYLAAADGRIPCYRAGKRVRFRLSEVEEAIRRSPDHDAGEPAVAAAG